MASASLPNDRRLVSRVAYVVNTTTNVRINSTANICHELRLSCPVVIPNGPMLWLPVTVTLSKRERKKCYKFPKCMISFLFQVIVANYTFQHTHTAVPPPASLDSLSNWIIQHYSQVTLFSLSPRLNPLHPVINQNKGERETL